MRRIPRSSSLRLLLCSLALSGCASQPAETETAAPAPALASGSESTSPVSPSEGGLVGDWVEYWALSGNADTQRYAFTQDGSFEWRAPEQAGGELASRSGRYALTPAGVELSVVSEQLRGPCEASAACVRAIEPPKAETLELAECPPNEEARALDASYRCISLGGRAFWRKR